MKFKNLLKALIVSAFICSQVVIAQVGSPAVSSGVRFEQYPVELSTGLPQVSIPLYSMPTRSKDINLDISLSYHQSSISRKGFRSGNCGRGWYLSLGGVLQRENKDGVVYSFNFMGYSGKVMVNWTSNGGAARITENKGPQITASTVYSGTTLQSVTFYDNKGYKYVFATKDFVNVTVDDDDPDPTNDVIIAANLSLQLTDIYDTNNNLLIHFNYNVHDEIVKINNQTRHNTINMVKDIQVPGFGSIVAEEDMLQDDFGGTFIYVGFVVNDFLGNQIKNAGFNQLLYYDNDKRMYTKNSLISASIGDQNYQFYYHPVVDNSQLLNSLYLDGFDFWGYPNVTSTYCRLNEQIIQLVDKKNVINGVLEKIQYPTGGSVVYEYESNTYSYDGATQPDLNQNGVPDPEYYFDELYPENNHNYVITELVNAINTTFSISQDQEVYVKVQGQPTPVNLGNGQIEWVAASFKLKNVTTGVIGALDPADNGENNCLGHLLNLQPGVPYQITMGTGTAPQISVYTRIRTTTPGKYWHGGGIRVKRIAFFDVNAPQDYFYSTLPQTVGPVKTMFYKYNSFANPAMSSGCLLYSNDDTSFSFISYSNVSVSDSNTNKRTDYTFYSPLDNLGDYSYGKVKVKNVYDWQNVLQQSTTYSYVTLAADSSGGGDIPYDMGWIMPSQVLTNEYLGSTLVTKENYEYDTFRNIKKKTVATSRSSESLISNYYYHLNTDGTPFTTNRVSAVDHIDELVGTTPLSTSKIVYSNTWTDTQGNNTSYLPSQVLTGKGAGTPEIKIRNNKYDRYGNILESEQEGGLKKSFIWGYNDTTIIAEISGVAYSSIPIALINAAKTASNSTNPNFNLNETNLLAALTNLRNAPEVSGGLITTYTYKPLVGVSTVTDPRGYKLIYEYDADGRQKAVKDQDGFIISENIYHTKPQN